LVGRRGNLRKVPFEAHGGLYAICDVIASSPSLERQPPTRSAVHLLIRRIMRLFLQQIVRTTRCARYNKPSLIFARHLASTHPIYEHPPRDGDPRTSFKVSGRDHSAESYFKEVDSSPPADSSTYQVDASSDAVQRPHTPPSGEYSQAGVGSEEYSVVDKETPYDPPSQGDASEKLGYGGKNQWSSEKGRETSRSNESPNEASAAGRKPEGRK
jgi:hypothetical protein